METGWKVAGWSLLAFFAWALWDYLQGNDPVADTLGLFANVDDGFEQGSYSDAGGTVGNSPNDSTRALIKSLEGVGPNGLLNAYQDSAGVWTIGWGSTTMPDGSRVVAGSTLDNEQQAEDLLTSEMDGFSTWINKNVTVPLSQNQYNALMGWVLNVGEGSAASSQLLRSLNSGDYSGASTHFLDWVKAHVDGVKVTVQGLVNRETTLTNLFNSGS